MQRFGHRIVASLLLALLPAGAARAQSGNHLWSVDLGLRGGYTDISYGEELFDYSSVMSNLSAGLAYRRYTETSLFSIRGWTSNAFLSDVRMTSFGGALAHHHELSQRARLSFGGGASSGLNTNELFGNGVFLLDSDIVTAYATGAFDYDASEKTQIEADFGASWFDFDLGARAELAQFAIGVPLGEEILIPGLPEGLPDDDAAPALPFDASQLALHILATEGVGVARFSSLTAYASGGLSHAFSSRTEASVNALVRRFDADGIFLEGYDLGVRAGLGHRLSSRTRVSSGYRFRKSLAFDPGTESHSGEGEITHAWTPHVSVSGSGGLTYFRIAGPAPSRLGLIGGAGLSATYSRTVLTLDYHRAFHQSLGFGRSLTSDLANASLSQALSNRVATRLFAGFRHSRDASEERFSFRVLVGGADLSYRLTPGLAFGAGYFYQRIDRDPLEIGMHFANLFLLFGTSWK